MILVSGLFDRFPVKQGQVPPVRVTRDMRGLQRVRAGALIYVSLCRRAKCFCEAGNLGQGPVGGAAFDGAVVAGGEAALLAKLRQKQLVRFVQLTHFSSKSRQPFAAGGSNGIGLDVAGL